jgi:hypothetical protein
VGVASHLAIIMDSIYGSDEIPSGAQRLGDYSCAQ